MPGKTPKKAGEEARIKHSKVVGAPEQILPPLHPSLPVIAMGASAGGLEAFETFFKNVSPITGAAFVVISHLDPKHPSIMSELIGRFTTMDVHEAADDTALQPNHVYVIPPNRDLSIFHGRLQLTEQLKSPGVRMPIDTFLRSLADDRGDSAIAIILSGTGTDGTLGLRALQASGGVIIAQDPDEAKYDGMPRSAIKTGLADYVLPVKEIAEQLATLLERHFGRKDEPVETTPDAIQKVLMVVRSKTGHDFTLYKKSTVGRRIRRRMNIHNIKDSAGYIRYLREHPKEADNLLKELLISVTNFFRDPDIFENLKETAFPELLRDKPDDYAMRAWVPGCATGEEAYSLAIVMQEYAEEKGRDYRFQIFATDIDEAAVGKARIGLFPSNIALDVSEARLAKFFVMEEAGYR
ncbi:MAG: chemotaxis protein CheB, partial [Syntrophorhabdaceae bacterium]